MQTHKFEENQSPNRYVNSDAARALVLAAEEEEERAEEEGNACAPSRSARKQQSVIGCAERRQFNGACVEFVGQSASQPAQPVGS